MRIVSYNIQHLKNFKTGAIDPAVFIETIKNFHADLIGLQEVRGEGPDPDYTAQAETLAKGLGYHFFFAKAIDVGGKNPYGNALLSRYPILKAEVVPIPDPEPHRFSTRYESRCILKATVLTPLPLTVLVTHFGLNEDEAENAAATVIKTAKKKRCVLMGDFNLTPESPILNGIRARFTDTAQLFSSEKLSFPSDHPDSKIDYLFCTGDLHPVFADIPPVVCSDHRPYLVDF